MRTAGRPIETAGFESLPPVEGDWLVSRERGWGAPLPIWECGGCAARQVPSLDELAQWAGHPLSAFDLHALSLDRLQLACPACGGRLQRAAGVLDEWFELGALPFFLGVAPPADLVCAGGEDGRLWLAALGTLSTLIAGQDGSRQVLFSAAPASVGEPAPDLLETLRKDGADALRWSVYTAQRAAEAGDAGAAWAGETVLQGLREVQAWLLAAEAAKPSATRPPAPETPPSPLDRWLNSRLQALAEEMTAAMERGEVSGAAEALGRFVTEDLGGWYLRLVRPSIGTPPPALRTALAALSALLAPFAPFLAENLFQKLVRFEAIDAPASIMLAEWPTSIAESDPALEADMAHLRQLAALGEQARAAANLQPGQPLALARLAAPGVERLVNEYSELLKAALNVQALQVIEGLSSEAPPEWSTAVQDEAAVALDARLTPALERQGLVGELARRVQDFRRRSEFEPAERIRIFLSATPRLAEAVEEYRERLLAETLCDDLQRFEDSTLQPTAEREKRLFTIAEFGGERVTFGIEKLAGPAEQKKAPST